MTEADVTLSDYALFLLCLIFIQGLSGNRFRHPIRPWVFLFFGSIGLASLMGGSVHGFFLDPGSMGYQIFWPGTLLSVGLSAFAGWGIGARILFSKKDSQTLTIIVASLFAVYIFLIVMLIWFNFSFPGWLDKYGFRIAVIHYLPAAVFLTYALGRLYYRHKSKPALSGILSMLLMFVAAGAQQMKITIHPVYLTHNTFYHLIQGTALFMFFWFAHWFLSLSKENAK